MDTYKHKIRANFILTMTLVLVACVAFTNAQITKQDINSETSLPSGDWNFSAHPDSRVDFDSVPVYLYSLTTDAKKGLKVISVGLWNRSSKPVISVKLRWLLTTEEDRNQILFDGQSQQIVLEKPLKENETLDLRTSIESFAQLSRSLTKDKSGTLSGNYRLDVVVVEATFEDDSIWARTSIKSNGTNAFGDCGTRNCQKQTCKYTPDRGYTCINTEECEACRRDTPFQCTLISCFGPNPNKPSSSNCKPTTQKQ